MALPKKPAQKHIHIHLVVCCRSAFHGWRWHPLCDTGVHAGNYRHQADVAHAYQVLVKGGMPTDRIVVMMEDDIAFNPYNPVPGKVDTAVQCRIVQFIRQATKTCAVMCHVQ